MYKSVWTSFVRKELWVRTENDQHSFSVHIEDDVVGRFLIGIVRTLYRYRVAFSLT